MKIAVIGLGRMGSAIATHIRHALPTLEMVVYDTQDTQVQQWAEVNDAIAAGTPAQAAQDTEFLVTSLPADKELLAVAQQVQGLLSPNSIWIDHSTTSAQVARDLAKRLGEHSTRFLDAPVSGGVEGAKNGALTVMVGGDEQAFKRAEPIITTYAARINHMGDSGAGQVTKMTNQICVLGLCQALAEGLDFAQRAGLDAKQVVEVMLQGSSTSWQMQNRAELMLSGEYDFGFSTALMRKDVGLVLEEAHAMGASLPATELVSRLLDDVDAMGGAQWDWCSLMERQRQV